VTATQKSTDGSVHRQQFLFYHVICVEQTPIEPEVSFDNSGNTHELHLAVIHRISWHNWALHVRRHYKSVIDTSSGLQIQALQQHVSVRQTEKPPLPKRISNRIITNCDYNDKQQQARFQSLPFPLFSL
jgi:hypothetical protein